MADICPVCNKEVSFWRITHQVKGQVVTVCASCDSQYVSQSAKKDESIDDNQASIETNTSGSTSFNGAPTAVNASIIFPFDS